MDGTEHGHTCATSAERLYGRGSAVTVNVKVMNGRRCTIASCLLLHVDKLSSAVSSGSLNGFTVSDDLKATARSEPTTGHIGCPLHFSKQDLGSKPVEHPRAAHYAFAQEQAARAVYSSLVDQGYMRRVEHWGSN